MGIISSWGIEFQETWTSFLWRHKFDNMRGSFNSTFYLLIMLWKIRRSSWKGKNGTFKVLKEPSSNCFLIRSNFGIFFFLVAEDMVSKLVLQHHGCFFLKNNWNYLKYYKLFFPNLHSMCQIMSSFQWHYHKLGLPFKKITITSYLRHRWRLMKHLCVKIVLLW